MRGKQSRPKIRNLLLVASLTLIPLLPLVYRGFPQTHDGYHHFVRIAHLVQAFREGNLLPTWAGNLNQGLGSLLFLFNWLLPYYMVLPLVLVHVPIVSAVKVVIGLLFILSVIGFYLWIRLLFGDKPALVASLIYLTAPYQLHNIFVRGAFGEAMGLAIAPWLFYTASKLLRSGSMRWFTATTLVTSLLILAHQPTALMIVALLVIYATVFWYQDRTAAGLKTLPLAILTASLLTLFFWFPSLVEMPYTKLPQAVKNVYEVHFLDADRFATPARVAALLINALPSLRAVRGLLLPTLRLLYVLASLTLAVGIAQTLAVVYGTFLLLKSKQTTRSNQRLVKPLALLYLITFAVSLFLTTKAAAPIWRITPLLPSLLYPWRLYGIATLAATFLAATALAKTQKRSLLISGVLLSAALIMLPSKLPRPEMFQVYPDSQLYQDRSSTDIPGGYLPRWAPNTFDLPTKPPNEIAISQGAEIRTIILERGVARLRFRAIADRETQAVINSFFFPAWQAFVDRVPTPITPSPDGRIQLVIPPGQSEVELVFSRSPIRSLANRVSTATLLTVIVVLLAVRLKNPTNRNRLTLLAVAALATLLVAEGVARVLAKKPDIARCIRLDETTHHTFIPNASCTFTYPDWGTVTVATNSLGLRDREIEVPKPEKVFRILMLGDSFTEGIGVELEDTSSKQLERMLRARFSDRRIEVVNAGIRASSPLLEYLYLRERWLKLEPDLVIVNVDANDISDEAAFYRITQVSPDGTIVRASELEGNYSSVRKLHFAIAERSALYRIVSQQIVQNRNRLFAQQLRNPKERIGHIEEDLGVALRETVIPNEDILWHWPEKSLRAIASLTKDNHIPLILTAYPYAVQVNGEEWPGRVQNQFELGKIYPTRHIDWIAGFATREGIPFVNTLEAFRKSEDFPLYHPTDGHFSPAGHRVFAEELFKYLIRNREKFRLPPPSLP